MACSQTGSGKTLAFLLPIINLMLKEGPKQETNHITEDREVYKPTYLILVPTRELAEQVFEQAIKITFNSGIRVHKIFGGVRGVSQLNMMKNGVDILVATPGRLIDFLENKQVSLSNIRYVTMDEADLMLDIGFGPQLEKITKGFDMPNKNKRLNLMFSATFEKAVQNIAANILRDGYYFITNNLKNELKPNENVEQTFIEVANSPDDKLDKLLEILKNDKNVEKVISNKNFYFLVFCATKKVVKELNDELNNLGHKSVCIHSDKDQSSRKVKY
jgi:ATP-dependent RNA helicase DDX3X